MYRAECSGFEVKYLLYIQASLSSPLLLFLGYRNFGRWNLAGRRRSQMISLLSVGFYFLFHLDVTRGPVFHNHESILCHVIPPEMNCISSINEAKSMIPLLCYTVGVVVVVTTVVVWFGTPQKWIGRQWGLIQTPKEASLPGISLFIYEICICLSSYGHNIHWKVFFFFIFFTKF